MVVLDSAAALSMLSVAIMVAATGIVVPVRPTVLHLASVEHYLRMAGDARGRLGDRGYAFVRLIGTRVDWTKRRQVETLGLMRERLGYSRTHRCSWPAPYRSALPKAAHC